MTAVAPTRAVAPDDMASADFFDALCRVFPGSPLTQAHSVALVALLDDGTLSTVAELGAPCAEPEGRSVWSDEGWQRLARASQAWPGSETVMHTDRILVPVMQGPVLLGAIDWKGPTPLTTLTDDIQCRATDEFVRLLSERISARSRVART